MGLPLLDLLLVLLTAWAAGRLAARLGYPSVLGELLAGIALGPPLLGLLQPNEALGVIAEFGVLLMMLYVGMELDPKAVRRASTAGVLAAVGGFATPFVLCYLLVTGLGYTPMAGVFVGMAAGVTSLATKSRILLDLGLLDTRVAYVMMAGALVADTLSLLVFAGVLGVAEAGALEAGALGIVGLKAAAYFAVAVAVGIWVLPRVGRWLVAGQSSRAATLMGLVVIMLAYAEGAHLAGMHGVLGAFLAGMFLRENALGRKAAHEAMALVRDGSLGLLAPVFFVTAGFAVDPAVAWESPALFWGVFGLATVGKIAGTALFYLPTGHGWREGIAIGAGMNGRGAVEIIVAQVGLSMGLITSEVFSALVLMAVGTTALVPASLKWAAAWLERRGDLARARPARQGAIVVGAGPVARHLARALVGEDHPVRLVDANAAHVAAAEAEGLDAVKGSALDEAVLEGLGAAQVRHLVAATPNAEVNALAGRLAREAFAVPEVMVATRAGAEDDALAHVGGAALVATPAALEAWEGRAAEGRVHVDEVTLTPDLAARLSQSDVPTPLDALLEGLPLAFRRGDEAFPLSAHASLAAGDVVTVLRSRPPAQDDVTEDDFDRLVRQAPVIDLTGTASMGDFAKAAARALGPAVGLDDGAFMERLLSREATSSTSVLPGLAVPHVRLSRLHADRAIRGSGAEAGPESSGDDGAARFALALVRVQGGVPFPGADTPVRAAFVVVTGPEARSRHLRTLSAVAQVAQSDGFQDRWDAAPDAEALRELVLAAPRRRE